MTIPRTVYSILAIVRKGNFLKFNVVSILREIFSAIEIATNGQDAAPHRASFI